MEIKFKHIIPYGLVSSAQKKTVAVAKYLEWVKDMVEKMLIENGLIKK